MSNDPGAVARLHKSAQAALEAIAARRYGLYRYSRKPAKPGFHYGPAPSGPFHAEQVIDALVAKGLVAIDASGGSLGSVKATEAGKAFLTAGRQQ